MLKQNFPRKSSSYDEPAKKIFIGIAGGSASGKTTLCENITRQMAFDRNFRVQILSLDCFYKSIDTKVVDVKQYNFDHPNALDFDLAYETLLSMKNGKEKIQIPQYSFVEHKRLDTVKYASPANIIFFEGLMAFHDKRIRELLTYKIFIHCDDDIRLCRRLKRDIAERGRTVVSVLHQYNRFVKPAFRDFILPTLPYADLIIPGSRNNRVSVDFIVQHIKSLSKHINFREQVKKTKIYCFGENEYYDLEYRDSTMGGQMSLQQSSFLVFPNSQETQRQLEFYLSKNLLAQSFRYDYFVEIYISQFARIMKDLFIQLMQLKNMRRQQIEIYSIYDLNELFESANDKKVKVIFIPAILNIDAKNLLQRVKQFQGARPNVEIVLLNFFSSMTFPSLIYELEMKATVLINLFIVTNEKRFSEIMIGNALFQDHSFNWLICNRTLTEAVVKNLCEALKIQNAVKGQNIVKTYDSIISRQKVTTQEDCQKPQILKQQVQVGNYIQLPMYPQQHNNLCGYHALNAIMCSTTDLLSKQTFIENFNSLKKLLIVNYTLKEYLKRTNYQPLQRNDLEAIISWERQQLKHQLFDLKHVTCLFYSFGYIQNNRKQIFQLEQELKDLLNGVISELYIIMGVVDHYFLIKLAKGKIYFMDSLNTPIKQLLNIEKGNSKGLTFVQKRKREMAIALEIIQQLYLTKKSIYTIIAERKIFQIMGSYFDFKERGEAGKWFEEEYKPQVLLNDLFSVLSTSIIKSMSSQANDLLKRWQLQQEVQRRMGNMVGLIKQ